MKKLLNVLSAFGLCCLFCVTVYAQNCTIITKIEPEQLGNAIVGNSVSGGFSAHANVPYVPGAIFTVTAGALPPGITLVENQLVGLATTAGTYSFTIGALSAPGCPIFEKQYTVTIDWNLSCDQFKLYAPYGESGYHLVGVYEYFGVCTTHTWDSIEYTVLSLPPAFTLRDAGSCPEVTGTPLDTGIYTMSIKATVPSGCSDTLTFTHHWTCLSVDSIYPQPYQLKTLPGRVGKYYSRFFTIDFSAHSISIPIVFKTLTGTLPPGLYFENDPTNEYISYLKGVPTTPGVYNFTVGAQLGNDCIIVQHDYTMTIYDTLPCNALKMTWPIISGTYNYVGEYQVFPTCQRVEGWDSVQYTLVDAPTGFSLNYIDSTCIEIAGRSHETGPQNFALEVKAAGGCRDTLVFTRIYSCPPITMMSPSAQQLPNAMRETFYSQKFEIGTSYVEIAATHFEVTAGALPPGLSIRDSIGATAYLIGTPTATGNYTFTITGSVGDCPGFSKPYTLTVIPHQTIKSLSLTPTCVQSFEKRNWRVYNPNNFPVQFVWETVYNTYHYDSLTAIPGNTYFQTPNVANPNTIRIKWHDQNYIAKSVVRGASNEFCNTPACVFAASIVSYHQGLRKDGTAINAKESDPTQALGLPDANDGLWYPRSFTLGYSGFIILELSNNVYDQPGNDLTVIETSENNPHYYSYPERAEVFVSKNGTQWISLGLTGSASQCNEFLDHAFDLAGKTDWCRYIKVVDKTDRHAKALSSLTCTPTNVSVFGNYTDGFDLDAITCGQSTTFARLGTDEENAISDQNIYILSPNPAEDQVTLDLSRDRSIAIPSDGRVQINILDVSGSDIYTNTHVLTENGTITLEIADFQSGMYILNVRTGIHAARFYKFIKR
jgi:hypothetical protein